MVLTTLDAAMFYTMLAMAFGFMFVRPANRNKVYGFRLLSAILFFFLGLILNSQVQIVYEEDIVNPSNQTYHDTTYVMHNNTHLLGLIFLLIALTNVIMFVLAIADKGTKEAEGKNANIDF